MNSLAFLRRVISCFDLPASLLSVKQPFETTCRITRVTPRFHSDSQENLERSDCRIFKSVGRVKRGMKFSNVAARIAMQIR